MIKHIFFRFILISYKKTLFIDKINFFFQSLIAASPVVFLLNNLGLWFEKNIQFCSFYIAAIIINMIVGAIYHRIYDTFCWKEMRKKNFGLIAGTIVSYAMLEMISLIIGENAIGQTFRITIQLMTLMYPISKIMRNIFILSDKKYPPAALMERIYKFEKTMNPSDLIENNK